MWLMPDISHWQGHHTREDMVQAATVASSIMFKATQGNGFIDPEFRSNVEAANGASLPWGAYHFVDTVDEGDGIEQAEHFWRVASSVPNLRFLLIDWERAWRPLALDLSERLRVLAGDIPVGDYIGSHARSQGGQLSDMDFHMVPQYGPADLDPRYETDPLSAWQYTNGEVNGTDWPNGVPGIGPCDMSAVYRPQDFGFGDDNMATLDLSQDIYPHPDKTQTLGNVLRELDEVLPTLKALSVGVANLDDTVVANLRAALTEELAKLEFGDVSADQVAAAVLQKYIEKLSS